MSVTQRPPLLCFSHLRWDFVWQRPQQLMSRFARERRVYFIEEPVFRAPAGEAPDGAVLEVRQSEGVTVVQPVCRQPALEEGWRLEALYARRVAELVAAEGLTAYTAWFYSPMFLPALQHLTPGLVVYDAMDELSLFQDAPAALLPRERQLLARADVVFTGGVSLGRAKAQRHPNVHPFPSGVEVEHYRQALAPQTVVPAPLARLPRPRAGFFGVLDERLDLALLAAVAAARPQVQFVLLGPVAKIDPARLPQGPNLHYLGQQAYGDLPAYVKGFDVCLLPFARTAATRFISPTKTLEYMAAHKPIISTPIADVVESYGAVVRLATGAAEFVAALDAALNESPQARAARLATERRLLARSTWDAIATAMDECMARAEEAKEPAPQVGSWAGGGSQGDGPHLGAVATAATATSR